MGEKIQMVDFPSQCLMARGCIPLVNGCNLLLDGRCLVTTSFDWDMLNSNKNPFLGGTFESVYFPIYRSIIWLNIPFQGYSAKLSRNLQSGAPTFKVLYVYPGNYRWLSTTTPNGYVSKFDALKIGGSIREWTEFLVPVALNNDPYPDTVSTTSCQQLIWSFPRARLARLRKIDSKKAPVWIELALFVIFEWDMNGNNNEIYFL